MTLDQCIASHMLTPLRIVNIRISFQEALCTIPRTFHAQGGEYDQQWLLVLS